VVLKFQGNLAVLFAWPVRRVASGLFPDVALLEEPHRGLRSGGSHDCPDEDLLARRLYCKNVDCAFVLLFAGRGSGWRKGAGHGDRPPTGIIVERAG
jgi:hypothetical protein